MLSPFIKVYEENQNFCESRRLISVKPVILIEKISKTHSLLCVR